MLRVDCYDFFKLAVSVHPLTLIRDDEPLSENWVKLYLAKAELLSFFNIFPLKTCQSPARVLYQHLLNLVPDDFAELQLSNLDGTPRLLNFAEATDIRNMAKEFETVLKAELSNWDTYFVSQKGAFSTGDLISSAENMISEGARAMLSPSALEDVRQCGRSIAFNMGTAAAFHIVRATETFIWKYYEAVVGHLPAVRTRNWGAYLINLEKSGKADEKVLGWMRQIKNQYRNPVLHPDEIVLPDDALEFVNACISLMTAIARVLPKGRVPHS